MQTVKQRASVKRWAVVISAMAWLSVTLGGQPSKDGDAVSVRRVPGTGYVGIVVENHRAYDATVTLTIRGQNVRVTQIVPETSTYAGHSQTEAVRVYAADATKPWKWRYRFHWTKGSVDARHDDKALYRLPFEKGRSCRVSQGYNGRLSHRDVNQYAVDFAMPEGTTVCAAREGLVVDLKESSDTGGPDKKHTDESNYVSIAHADGTIGEYHHLEFDGVLVEIGDRVAAGQAIARSGNTGYSTFPHLHFGVYSAADAEHMRSHPVTFTTAQGVVGEPRAGRIYTAQ
jgi:murein DD-endopeptidase MepM/ murein hydrolase activator NlpD